MKYLIVALFALVSPALCRPQAPSQPAPQQHPQPASQQRPQPAPQPQGGSGVTPVSIVSQTEVVGPDGSFNYSYDASNGIHVEQGGYVKKAAESRAAVDPNNPEATGDIQVIQGAFSYTAPDGEQISLRYIADENGFQPEGAHLPQAPPVPEGIARSLEQQGQQQQQQQPLGAQRPQTFAAQQPQQAQPFGAQQPQTFAQQPQQQQPGPAVEAN